MFRIFFAIFLILHGLVHLLYLGQSLRLFELQPGMLWPAGSWALSTLLKREWISRLAAACCLLLAAGFVTGGIGLLAGRGWWRLPVVVAAAVSAALFIVLWDGRLHALDDQGAVNLLINVAILALVVVWQWPVG